MVNEGRSSGLPFFLYEDGRYMQYSLRLCLIILAILPLPASSAAKRKDNLSERHAKWLTEDVVYIITEEEKKEFVKLASDEERDKFVDEFWEVRNPRRGTRSNPFKDEHYARIAYANQTFGHRSNTLGWMTDQGRTWIELGKPVSRAQFMGYSQIYPLELWFYDNNTSNPALPSFFYLMFFMPEDIGEYKHYLP